MNHALLLVALATIAAPAAAEEGKIAVLPVQLEKSAEGKVPNLIGEVLLTAVQSATRDDVIGQEDINALIGFEKQKSLLGCDDVACMAEIGGALGVQRIVGVKIALLEADWVVTCKLMNIVTMKVESRSSDFVTGDTKALLAAIPAIINKLFAGGGASVPATPATLPQQQVASPTQSVAFGPTTAPAALRYDEAYGGGARVGGTVLYLVGAAVAVAGAVVTISGINSAVADIEANYCQPGTNNDTDTCWDSHRSEILVANAIGAAVYTPGMVLSGIGSSVYLNGEARATTATEDAKGYHPSWWWGWVFLGISIGGPLIDSAALGTDFVGYLTGIGGLLGALGVFGYTMLSDSGYARTSDGVRVPMANLIMLRDGERAVPGLALTFAF